MHSSIHDVSASSTVAGEQAVAHPLNFSALEKYFWYIYLKIICRWKSLHFGGRGILGQN